MHYPLPQQSLRLALRAANARALALLLRQDERPRWRELATIRATLGLMGDTRVPRFASAALGALGETATWLRTLGFAWDWWYQGATHFLHSYQAARLTVEWCAKTVVGDPRLPPEGAVLLSAHHFNQRLGWIRLSNSVEQLGIVSFFGFAEAMTAAAPVMGSRVDDQIARYQLATLYARTFGDRMYQPRAIRQALRVLDQNGHVIISPDGYSGSGPGTVLGRRHALGRGALWLARQSGRPIVPFTLMPQGDGWRLWCGEPMTPEDDALERGLELCIRRAPTTWMLWPDWVKAPVAYAR